MTVIKLLPDKLINLIAAGEVVERPASVVKELVENAIDAGASSIVIELEEGGKKSIVVRDNGCGMAEDDVYLAVERHATSKLADPQDLHRIVTMGFRGEALPSIASVSLMTVKSALSHGSGFMARFKAGNLVKSEPVPMPQGTEIAVEKLFFNTPVRRRFLKSDEREYQFIKELVQKFAVCNPSVAFSFSHNGRSVLDTPQQDDRLRRLAQLWKVPQALLRNASAADGTALAEVIVAPPDQTVSGPGLMTVNGRIIADRKLNAVQFRVFREIAGGEFRGTALIALTIDYESVDINVHPSKLEVRFRDERQIFNLVEQALREALGAPALERIPAFEPFGRAAAVSFPTRGAGSTVSGSIVPQVPAQTAFTELMPQSATVAEPATEYVVPPLRSSRVAGTVFGLYIMVESGDNLYFIDQHAAHERLIYRRLLGILSHKSGLSQIRLQPLTVHLSPLESDEYDTHGAVFTDLGFVIERFDEQSLLIRGVPALQLDPQWDQLVKEMLAEMAANGIASAWNERLLSFFASRACKAAVKQNDVLTEEEIALLLSDIARTEVLTCPHGRRFVYTLKKNELERGVGR